LPERHPKFIAVADGRLVHGEILCGLLQVRQRLSTIGTDNPVLDSILHPYATVVTQDCDLESDFRSRKENGKASALMHSVLLCETMPTSELKGAMPGSDVWKRVVRNQDERFHCLEFVAPDQDSAGEGIVSLGLDFKRYFTVPTDEIYRRIELRQIRRRSALISPYAENLLCRFYNYQARIPIPENHDINLTAVQAAPQTSSSAALSDPTQK
jgi:hypothetical protein